MSAPQFAPPTYPAQQLVPQQFGQPYPPQQFAPGYPAPMPAVSVQPLAQGSLDDFYAQPSTGGGAALKFEQVGQRYTAIVARPVTSADIQQQTDTQGRPQTFRDGRPKFVMKVPLQMQPTPAYPDGLAQWYVKGQARDELVRAMAEAGAPAGPPEAGAIVDVTFTGTRPSGPGMNPAKQVHVVYTRPDGTTSSPAPAIQQAPVPQAAPAPMQQPAPPAPQPSVPAQAVAQPQPPQGLSPDQQALLAKLTAGGN